MFYLQNKPSCPPSEGPVNPRGAPVLKEGDSAGLPVLLPPGEMWDTGSCPGLPGFSSAELTLEFTGKYGAE